MKHVPFNPPPGKLFAITECGATQVIFPLDKQPPVHLDSVYPPSAYRKGFEFYQQQFAGANLDIRKYPDVLCPLGKKGDLLYLQEAWSNIGGIGHEDYLLKRLTPEGLFTDRNKNKPWQPPATMPKIAARIWLRVTDVHLQRVQSITKEQARAEGPYPVPEQNQPGLAPAYVDHLRKGQVCYGAGVAFKQWWKAFYGKKSYEKNVWVWVVSFEPCENPMKPALSESVPPIENTRNQ